MVYEKSLMKPLEEHYMGQGFETYFEVPMYSKKIDMVCISPDFSNIIAVEAKVSRWQKALKQAMAHRLCANKVYVAMWHEFAHRPNIDLFDKFGIGLLEVNGGVKLIHEAKESNKNHQSVKQNLREYLIKESRGKNG